MSKKNREKRQLKLEQQSVVGGQIAQENKSRRKLIIALLVIIIAPIVTYWNSLEGEFHFDDYSKIVENPDIRTLKGVFVDGPKRSEPRMVSNFTLYLNYRIDGYNVRYYHAFNIGLHVINCILIYFVVLLTLRKVGIDKRYLAFLVSLFFALHPINTEPLNYIVHGRFIILCTMFYLLGILLFILAFEPGRKKWLYLAGCFICYILSVFSKEVGITLPGVLFFYYLYFICDSRKAFLKAVTLFGVAMALVITYALWYGLPGILKERFIVKGQSSFNMAMVEYLIQLKVAITYLKLYLLPLPSLLNVDHPINFILSYQIHIDIETIFSAGVIIGLIIFAIAAFKRLRLISFSLLYLFIAHSPTTLARKGEIIAEYKNYLPFFGFAFLAILCLSKLLSYFMLGRKGAVAAILIIAVFFSFAVVERNKVWRNDLLLWSDCVAKTPGDPRGYNMLSFAKGKLGDVKGAMEAAERAIRLDPNEPLPYLNRGSARAELGDLKGAIEDYNRAIQLDPTLAKAYYNRGITKNDLGDPKSAIEDFDRAIQINPDFVQAYCDRGITKAKLGDYKGAIGDYDKVIKMDSGYESAYHGRGAAKGELGDYKGAIEDFDRAIQINPNSAQAYYDRGVAKAMLGDFKGAIIDYDKAIEINPNYAQAYNNRGNAKGDLGDYRGAIADWEKAIELVPSYREKLQPPINDAKTKINR